MQILREYGTNAERHGEKRECYHDRTPYHVAIGHSAQRQRDIYDETRDADRYQRDSGVAEHHRAECDSGRKQCDTGREGAEADVSGALRSDRYTECDWQQLVHRPEDRHAEPAEREAMCHAGDMRREIQTGGELRRDPDESDAACAQEEQRGREVLAGKA